MKINFKLLVIIFCVFFCKNIRAEDNTLCTTSTINTLIESKYKDDAKLKEVWAELQAKGVLRVKDSDASVRPPMVKIQSLIESSLAALLKKGVIKYSKAVIYMPLPSTPLRADDSNLNTLVEKEFFDDKDRLKTIIDRMVSTKDYLSSGGQIYSMHETLTADKTTAIPGITIYKNNLIKYQGKLIDTPISKINTRYTGACYIAYCQDGTKIFFAIKSRQEDNTKPRQWCLYYGSITNKKLSKHFEKLKEVYKKSAEIPFDFS